MTPKQRQEAKRKRRAARSAKDPKAQSRANDGDVGDIPIEIRKTILRLHEDLPLEDRMMIREALGMYESRRGKKSVSALISLIQAAHQVRRGAGPYLHILTPDRMTKFTLWIEKGMLQIDYQEANEGEIFEIPEGGQVDYPQGVRHPKADAFEEIKRYSDLKAQEGAILCESIEPEGGFDQNTKDLVAGVAEALDLRNEEEEYRFTRAVYSNSKRNKIPLEDILKDLIEGRISIENLWGEPNRIEHRVYSTGDGNNVQPPHRCTRRLGDLCPGPES